MQSRSKIDVLDKGFIEVIDVLGKDFDVADAARVSYDRRSSEFTDDRNLKLIKYLWSNGHTSPFEMIGIKFRYKAPLMVVNQILRHRIGSQNYKSYRYVEASEEEFYLPSEFRIQDTKNKQASTNSVIDAELYTILSAKVNNIYNQCYALYKELVSHNISREQARIVLPGFSLYTEGVVFFNGLSLFNFFKKRTSLDAQYETRQYAIALKQLFADKFSLCYKVFNGEV